MKVGKERKDKSRIEGRERGEEEGRESLKKKGEKKKDGEEGEGGDPCQHSLLK